MRKLRIGIFILLAAFLLPMPVMAVQQVDLSVSVYNIAQWDTVTRTLNLSDSTSVPGASDMSIKFQTVEQTTSPAKITIVLTGSNLNSASPMLTRNSPVCIRGAISNTTGDLSCNRVTPSSNAVEVTLTSDIRTVTDVTPTPTTTATPTPTPAPALNSSTDDDVPAYAYISVDVARYLSKNTTYTFDAGQYSQTTGWTTDKTMDELPVYFVRKTTNSEMSITLDSQSDPKLEWLNNYNTALYHITESGTYKWTITYKEKQPWGGVTDKSAVYTLVVKGMKASSGSSSSSSVISVIGSYEISVSDDKVLTMSANGSFDPLAGMTVTPMGDNRFQFKFSAPGVYKPTFKATSGASTQVEFDVKAVETPTPSQTSGGDSTTANQGGNGAEGGWDGYLFAGGVLVLIIIVAYILIRRRSGSGRHKLHIDEAQ